MEAGAGLFALMTASISVANLIGNIGANYISQRIDSGQKSLRLQAIEKQLQEHLQWADEKTPEIVEEAAKIRGMTEANSESIGVLQEDVRTLIEKLNGTNEKMERLIGRIEFLLDPRSAFSPFRKEQN